MKRFLGEAPREIELPDGAVLRDLLEYFGRHLIHLVPGHLWNLEEGRFRGPVVITIGRQVVRDMDEPLENGQEIQLFKALVGG